MTNAMRTHPVGVALIAALEDATDYPVGDQAVPEGIDGQDPDSFPYLTVHEISSALWGTLAGNDSNDTAWQIDCVGRTANQARIAADRIVDFMERRNGADWYYPIPLTDAKVIARVPGLTGAIEPDNGPGTYSLYTKSLRYTLRVTPD